jgi:hypothetical protein
MWLLRKPLVDEPVEDLQAVKEPAKSEPSLARPTRERSMTTSNFWPGRMNTKDEPKETSCPTPPHKQTKGPFPSRSSTLDGNEGKKFQSFFCRVTLELM